MVQNLLRSANALIAVIRVVACVLLVASVAINFANIVGRYCIGASLVWAEEAMLFLMIGCVFLGVALVGWSGKHIRMDVVVLMLPERWRAGFHLFSDLITIATSIAVAVFAWPVITMLAAFDQRSNAANIPLVIPQAMVPIGLFLMAFLIAVRLIVRHAGAGETSAKGADR